MASQHWFRHWLCVVRQQTITWKCWPKSSMPCASVGHNELATRPRDLLMSNFMPNFISQKYSRICVQCWKFQQVRRSEADNFGGGPGIFCWFFFNFMFMIWDSRHEDLQLFWLSFKHCMCIYFIFLAFTFFTMSKPNMSSNKIYIIFFYKTQIARTKFAYISAQFITTYMSCIFFQCRMHHYWSSWFCSADWAQHQEQSVIAAWQDFRKILDMGSRCGRISASPRSHTCSWLCILWGGECSVDTKLYIQTALTHWPLGDVVVILKISFSNSLCRTVAWTIAVELLSAKCQRTLQMRSQHWFR